MIIQGFIQKLWLTEIIKHHTNPGAQIHQPCADTQSSHPYCHSSKSYYIWIMDDEAHVESATQPLKATPPPPGRRAWWRHRLPQRRASRRCAHLPAPSSSCCRRTTRCVVCRNGIPLQRWRTSTIPSWIDDNNERINDNESQAPPPPPRPSSGASAKVAAGSRSRARLPAAVAAIAAMRQSDDSSSATALGRRCRHQRVRGATLSS